MSVERETKAATCMDGVITRRALMIPHKAVYEGSEIRAIGHELDTVL